MLKLVGTTLFNTQHVKVVHMGKGIGTSIGYPRKFLELPKV